MFDWNSWIEFDREALAKTRRKPGEDKFAIAKLSGSLFRKLA